MKIVVLVAALVLVAGCGEDDTEQPATGGTAPGLAELTVTVDDGSGGAPKTADVRCDAPEDSDACQAVADIKPKTFEPVPGNMACTQQYGGPETATVKGTINGEPVDAQFARVNGCEIARWNDAKDLLAAAA
jgi:hypothetical protein